MKKWVVLVLFIFLGLGCTREKDRAPSQGGVDGGGGELIEGESLGAENVGLEVDHSRLELALYIKGKMATLDPSRATPLERKLYLSSPNLWDILQTTDIDLVPDRPCYDSFGGGFDGSIITGRSDRICLSSPRIGAKARRSQAGLVIKPLILHELSHLLKATENEARELQKTVLKDLSELQKWAQAVDPRTPLIFARKAAAHAARAADIMQLQYYGESNWKHFDDEKLRELMRQFYSELNSLLSKSLFIAREDGPAWGLFDRREREFYILQLHRLRYLIIMLSSWMGDEDYRDTALKLEGAFGSDQSIAYADYLKANGSTSATLVEFYNDQKIERVHNREELKQQLWDLEKFFIRVAKTVSKITHDGRAAAVPLPELATTPWAKWKGEYRVLNFECHNLTDESLWKKVDRFKIEDRGQYNRFDVIESSLVLTERASSITYDVGRLDGLESYRVDFDSLPISEFISGHETVAFYEQEAGVNWGDQSVYGPLYQFKKLSVKFEKLDRNRFRVEKTLRQKVNSFSSAPDATCIYEVIPI